MQIRRFTVQPSLPERLAALETIAHNFWWSWNLEAIGLFRRLDGDLFSATGHCPVKMLGVIDQKRLETLCDDDGFLNHLDQVSAALYAYVNGPTWFGRAYGDRSDGVHIAYFSAEFGLHESFPIYSGGLGILAGDHLKSASDLGLPLAAVGLMYQQGYFRQYLNADGWQQERYPENDFYTMACHLERQPNGAPLVISVEYPGRTVQAQIWTVNVGRVPLHLLDANISQNNPDDRKITAQLYGGDQDMRIRQELLLGVGGLRALKALGVGPSVCHMNEGHSAFLAIERVATTMEKHHVEFAAAKQIVAAGTVFTTHTPVEAGNDMFPPYLVESYLEPFLKRLKIDKDELLGLGRQRPGDKSEPFCMTVLAIRLANHINGVSKLHGRVSRHMWRNIWPELPEDDIPIESITNGIHTKSFLCSEMHQLYDRYLGPDWSDRLSDPACWARAAQIPDAELWRNHERRRERLVAFARRRVRQQLQARGSAPADVTLADEVLDPEALTIGFARRFATYKRGTLLFRDPDRLLKIVNQPHRPVQIIFAGKAHPKDQGGKELIAQIIHIARQAEFRRRVVFIEDYDINVARFLVQGVDVWLNNPRRPLEASGTSGMKVPINGGVNCSILDGWWVEGYERDNGWAIGSGEEYSDLNHQDDIESRALYDLLEKEIVPLYYERQVDGLPRNWIKRVKRSIATVGPTFNTNRMVQEYTERFYMPAAERYLALAKDNLAAGLQLAKWLKRVESQWPKVKVESVEAAVGEVIRVGADVQVTARLALGDLKPEEIRVELYHGDLDATGTITGAESAPMSDGRRGPDGLQVFEGRIPCRSSGQRGFAVRVAPAHPHLPRAYQPGLIRWG